jgi:hypothetical protein
MNLKRLFSYIFPVTIHETHSEINNNLEVTWNNGRLVLDSKNTNFSYGSLQKVMHIGLNQIGKEKIKNTKNILVLGVAGGSVIKSLREEFHNSGKIKDVEIIIDDASKFVKKDSGKYDLIIIDIFQDKVMPDFLFAEDFIENIKLRLDNHGLVLFNTIVILSNEHERNYKFEKMIRTKFASVIKLSRIEGDNELFIFSDN